MARTTTYKKLGLPLGWWIFLSHKEACDWTSVPASQVRSFLIELIPGPWSKAVSMAISVQSNFIRGKNEQSGKKGVKLLFLWATGVITSVERLGTGKSPCGGGGSGSTGGGGAGPAGPRVPRRQN